MHTTFFEPATTLAVLGDVSQLADDRGAGEYRIPSGALDAALAERLQAAALERGQWQRGDDVLLLFTIGAAKFQGVGLVFASNRQRDVRLQMVQNPLPRLRAMAIWIGRQTGCWVNVNHEFLRWVLPGRLRREGWSRRKW